MSALALANTVAVVTPILAFFAGVYFAKWMGERRRNRGWTKTIHQRRWYREV